VIQQKEITRQTILKNQYSQETQLVQAETTVLVSEKQAQVTVINAQAQSDRVTLLSQGQADKIKVETSAIAKSYSNLKAQNNMTNDQVLRLMVCVVSY
jgi:regulator of protease activity HflC (stomatin/prohibitin superfamily)